MYYTVTGTATYTVVDIRKTFEGFESDLRMIARRTEKWTVGYVDQIFHDVIKLAEAKYLSSASIALQNSAGKVIKATKSVVNSDGTAISGARAGGNDWSNIPHTSLTIILSYTDKWDALTAEQKRAFQVNNDFCIGWVSAGIDINFPHLTRTSAQLYASNGYELQKQNYK